MRLIIIVMLGECAKNAKLKEAIILNLNGSNRNISGGHLSHGIANITPVFREDHTPKSVNICLSS